MKETERKFKAVEDKNYEIEMIITLYTRIKVSRNVTRFCCLEVHSNNKFKLLRSNNFVSVSI